MRAELKLKVILNQAAPLLLMPVCDYLNIILITEITSKTYTRQNDLINCTRTSRRILSRAARISC